MANRILLLGSSGQIGWELSRSLLSVGTVSYMTRKDCDLSDKTAIEEAFALANPDIVVNAAAFTNVDEAESEPDQARAINSELPASLAQLCNKSNALLVDYSTDYVFDGSKKTAYNEDDSFAPINEYGRSKLRGLEAILQSGCRHLIFRVSWVYSARRKNFAKTILRLASERDSLNIINDQFGTPCSSRWLADMTTAALHSVDKNRAGEGVYNLTPNGETTWFGFAQEIVRQAKTAGWDLSIEPEAIQPISTDQYPTPAVRPMNSRLDKSKFSRVFGLPLPDWASLVPFVIDECKTQIPVPKLEKS